MTHWIKTSPKRKGFLKVIAHEGIQIGIGATHTPILHYKNIDGWERFCLCHSFLIQLCEAIIHGTSEDKFSQHSSGWTQEDKNNALAHLKAIESFKFMYTLVTLQCSLLYLKEVSVKLQSINQDIASGPNLIDQCCSELKSLRRNVLDTLICTVPMWLRNLTFQFKHLMLVKDNNINPLNLLQNISETRLQFLFLIT